MSEKGNLRKRIFHNRKLLSDQYLSSVNNRIHSLTFQLIEEIDPQAVHAFLPIERNNEPDLWPLIHDLFEIEIEVMTSITNFKSKTMEHFWIKRDTLYVEGEFGIPQPKNCKKANLTDADVVLIPLLAFDKNGHRLGYGQGYYDRLISELDTETVRVGLNFSGPFDKFTFIEDHDMKLDYCISSKQVFRFE